MGFARKTNGSACLIPLSSLTSCRKGIQKRIRREQHRKELSDDPEYRRARIENIHRLRIIAKSLKELEGQL